MLFGGRTHQPIRVDHSAAPTPKLRAADEAARLALAVLKFKELMDHVAVILAETRKAILAAGNRQVGDVFMLPQFVEVMDTAPADVHGPGKAA